MTKTEADIQPTVATADQVEALDRVETGIKPISQADAAYIPVGGLVMTEEELKIDRRVNRKFDWCILPLLFIVFLFDGMDRSNIGNAATVDFLQTAKLSKNAVNNAASLFFITFIPLQPVSGGLGKYFGVARWLAGCMFFWGAMTLSNGFISGDASLYAVRLLVGVFESGFYPLCTFYISTLYPRFYLGRKLSLFYGSFTFAGCFSGLISYGILQWKGKSLYSWQYLFIVEGSLTMFFAVINFFMLPAEGCTAWFLTDEEKEWARERMQRDNADGNAARRGISKRDIIEVCKDFKMWTVVPGNISASVVYQAFNVFLPLIVQNLGYKSYRANLFAVPIYFIGTVGLVALAFSSDYFKDRTYHLLLAVGIVIIGSILVVTIESNVGRYVGLCIMNIGTYSQTPLISASLMNNTPSPGKRVLVMGVQGYGNLGGVIAGQLFLSKYAPKYRFPFYVSLGLLAFGWFCYLAYRMSLVYQNKRRAKIIANWTPEQIAEENANDIRRGDMKYTFVYTY
ncbi:Major facilitator superfamily domain, general substrate transporter [Niveomyces insectorum RCEF 264]|uniref:Major facilitator superfamily domain, general substrate transporter n=1 Tax=Niveomyces insectorum RCEF 264 TaxID=1081102 RepID=A0A167XS68_9HYPO|nr:Major facilitator superfamily domain, general substrate transporter [Niveomyces insectorum RCEF 264]